MRFDGKAIPPHCCVCLASELLFLCALDYSVVGCTKLESYPGYLGKGDQDIAWCLSWELCHGRLHGLSARCTGYQTRKENAWLLTSACYKVESVDIVDVHPIDQCSRCVLHTGANIWSRLRILCHFCDCSTTGLCSHMMSFRDTPCRSPVYILHPLGFLTMHIPWGLTEICLALHVVWLLRWEEFALAEVCNHEGYLLTCAIWRPILWATR